VALPIVGVEYSTGMVIHGGRLQSVAQLTAAQRSIRLTQISDLTGFQ